VGADDHSGQAGLDQTDCSDDGEDSGCPSAIDLEGEIGRHTSSARRSPDASLSKSRLVEESVHLAAVESRIGEDELDRLGGQLLGAAPWQDALLRNTEPHDGITSRPHGIDLV
jgi:hypothetical protein